MVLHYMIMCLFTLPFTTIAVGTTLQAAGSNYSSSSMSNIAKPGCQNKCGNVTIPYPFGIGTCCSLNYQFDLTCNTSSDSRHKTPQLFINVGETFRMHNISGQSYGNSRGVRIQSISDSELRIFNSASVICYQQDGNISFTNNSMTIFRSNGLLSLSEKNKFTVIGCFDRGLITDRGDLSFTSGCIGLCDNETYMPTDGQCSGKGCCQTSIPKGLNNYTVEIESAYEGKRLWESNRCGYAFVGEEGSFEFHGIRDLFNNNASEVVDRIHSTVPIVIDWVIATDNCSEGTECKDNSECYDVEGGGYRCRCNQGYEGNAYLEPGCQDINECNDPGAYPCYGACINTRGSYECNCPSGYCNDLFRFTDPKVLATKANQVKFEELP